MSDNQGGSFLSDAPADNGTPAAQMAPADQVAQEVMDGPPEWAPAKYWDAEKKSVRYEDLGRGYQSLEKLLGREKVPVPTGDDDKEGWERWYKASGRPDTIEDYVFERPTLPSDLPYDEESEKNFRTWAHVNGLTKKQASNLYDGYVKTQLERHASYVEGQKKQRSELEQALIREHGGRIENVKQTAFAVMQEHADGEFRQFLDQTGLGNDPRMVRFLHKVGSKMNGETRLKSGPPVQQANSADLDKSISAFRDKHNKALMDKAHPDHDRLATEFKRLFEARFPEAAR